MVSVNQEQRTRKNMQTNIKIEGEKIHIASPYSEENNAKYRALGGKFAYGVWLLPDNSTTRQTVAEMFGAKSGLVETLVPYDKITTFGKICQIGGYVLASRRGRDNRVEMPEGVSLAEGKLRSSGGSVKNPSVALDSDVVFRLVCRQAFAEANGLEIPTDEIPAVEV